jgi:hypothetical protein
VFSGVFTSEEVDEAGKKWLGDNKTVYVKTL